MGFLGNNKPEIGRAIITIANILNIVIQNLKNKRRGFEHFWSNVNLNRTNLDDPPVEWKPKDKKLRLWNE